jgi:hypothetical protein
MVLATTFTATLAVRRMAVGLGFEHRIFLDPSVSPTSALLAIRSRSPSRSQPFTTSMAL